MLRRTFVALSLLAGLAPAALAQGQKPVRIGVLNDLSGVYADYQGEGSIIAARMAVEDFGGKVAGRPVEVVFADHQNKTDVGASIARRWFDVDGVDMIVDVPNSAIALAINGLAREKNKVLIGSGAGTSELTGKSCSPNTVHWTYDTYSLGRSLGKALHGARAPRSGSSSPRTTPSARTSRRTQQTPCSPTAARSSARPATPSAPRTSRPSSCRRRTRART
jgi:branched-chain amino acid transport system substrate-binding protein